MAKPGKEMKGAEGSYHCKRGGGGKNLIRRKNKKKSTLKI